VKIMKEEEGNSFSVWPAYAFLYSKYHTKKQQ